MLADAGKLGAVGGVLGVLLGAAVVAAFSLYSRQNDVPEIVALTISQGSEEYLSWLDGVVR